MLKEDYEKKKQEEEKEKKKQEEKQIDNLEKSFSDSSLDSDDEDPCSPAVAQPLYYIYISAI